MDLKLDLTRNSEITINATIRVASPPPPPPSEEILVNMTTTIDGVTTTAKGVKAMAYTLPIGKGIVMQVAYTDAKGNPAKIDGMVAWSVSDDTILAITVANDPPDGSRVLVSGVGALGQAQLIATADADLGAGVRNLITPGDIEIVAGEAVSGSITPVGDPVDLPTGGGGGLAAGSHGKKK